MLGPITIFDILGLVVAVPVVALVHGLGHYGAARLSGVRVARFSIGLGPAIVGWSDRSGTRWRVGWAPFGGYVALARPGGDGAPVASRRRFLAAAVVALAGPTASLLFAVALGAGFIMTVGEPWTSPKIGMVLPDSPAAQAGLQPGDEILDLDGKPVDSFADVADAVSANAGAPIRVTVRRGDQPLTFSVTPRIVEETDRLGLRLRTARIGIRGSESSFDPPLTRRDPLTALAHAANNTCALVAAVAASLSDERRATALSGVIAIRQSPPSKLMFFATTTIKTMETLSVWLGLINLLPLPFLDGGRLLLAILGAIRVREPLPAKNDPS